MRNIIFGDIHGCFDELSILLQNLKVTKEDNLIFLGDLIDRGPKSNAVVDLLRQMTKDNYKVTLIAANHEDTHLQNHEHSIWNETELSLRNLEYIKTGKLYYQFKSGDKDFVCVHGGFTQEFFDMYENLPALDALMQDPLMYERAHRFLRTRRLDKRGRMVSMYRTECTLWGDIYDGRAGIALYGHETFDEVKQHKYAYGIDTGCAYGNKLTAAIVENGQISFESVSYIKKKAIR